MHGSPFHIESQQYMYAVEHEVEPQHNTKVIPDCEYIDIIFLEPIYFKAMQTKPVHKANIYHEIGHGFMGHVNRDPNNLKMISEGRAEAQSKGEVFWQEREADAFACHYVGKKAMLQHLQGIKQIAKTIAGSDPGFRVNLPTHINELDKRIRLIQDNNNF